jgi:hypothetical protein
VKKKIGLRQFIGQIKRLFSFHAENSDRLLYENTYVKLEASQLKYSIPLKEDKITLEMKKYRFSPPGKEPSSFFIVAASFGTNSFYNALMRLTFIDEEKAEKFYARVAELIKKNV